VVVKGHAENVKTGWLSYMDVYGFSSLIENADNEEIADILLSVHTKAAEKLAPLDHFQFFSDSIFLFAAHDTSVGSDSGDSLRAVLDASRAIINESVRHDLFLRGSLAFGEVVIRTNIILGKPILRAYRREQSLPFPVVIVPEIELEAGAIPQELAVHAIETKDGIVSAAPILPHTQTGFFDKVHENARRLAKVGPDQVALGWARYSLFLQNQIPVSDLGRSA
jgi:hypothetical protein